MPPYIIIYAFRHYWCFHYLLRAAFHIRRRCQSFSWAYAAVTLITLIRFSLRHYFLSRRVFAIITEMMIRWYAFHALSFSRSLPILHFTLCYDATLRHYGWYVDYAATDITLHLLRHCRFATNISSPCADAAIRCHCHRDAIQRYWAFWPLSRDYYWYATYYTFFFTLDTCCRLRWWWAAFHCLFSRGAAEKALKLRCWY